MSGLDSDLKQHFDWIGRAIKVGDRIEIEVLETDDVDDPASGSLKRPTPKAPKAPARASKKVLEKKPTARKKAASGAAARPSKKKK